MNDSTTSNPTAGNEPLQRAPSGRLINRQTFKQGNTWLVVQNEDFVFEQGYEGPLMPNMIVMYQTKARTAFRKGHSYGVDRYFYKITKMDEDGNLEGKVFESMSCCQDSDDESDVMSEEDEILNMNGVKGKIIGDSLQVDYPTHSRGVMQCYSRVATDDSFPPRQFKFDENGEVVDF